MAFYSIEKRKTTTGDIRYRCTVGVKADGELLHRERKTFAKQTEAKSWGISRVADIEKNGFTQAQAAPQTTLGQLIDLYLSHPHISMGFTKKCALTSLRKAEISNTLLNKLTQNVYVRHCQYRKAQGVSSATIRQDMSYIGSALKSASPLFDLTVDLQEYEKAKYHLRTMGMTSSGVKRSRRPTDIEVEKILSALRIKAENSYRGIPFDKIFMFSILSCMRIGEVTRILWEDIDYVQKSVIVRDRKDPRKKVGNHMSVPLLGEAWNIVIGMAKTDERIFPYVTKSVTLCFSRTTTELGIKDLRYHDLRREGASRLFEAGFSIEEVAQVTGHRNLSTLWQVYTELFPKSLHERYNELLSRKIAIN